MGMRKEEVYTLVLNITLNVDRSKSMNRTIRLQKETELRTTLEITSKGKQLKTYHRVSQNENRG